MALTDKLTAIGNAIRSKTGDTSPLTLDQMVAAITSIQSGGGSGTVINPETYEFYRSVYENGIDVGTQTTYTFPAGVQSVGKNMFENNNKVLNVVLTDDITAIQASAFENSYVESVEGGNIELIKDSAFYGASQLTTLDLSKVKTLEEYALYNCEKFTNGGTKILTLPELRTIGTYALAGLSNINKIYLPEITDIEEYGICSLDTLNYVEIGKDIINIGDNAFYDCPSLDIIRINMPVDSFSIPSNKWGASGASILWEGQTILDIQGSGLPSTYTIYNDPSHSYPFVLNDAGYWESTNKGVRNSFSMCRVDFYANGRDKLYFDYIQYAENTSDYGIFGHIDKSMSASSSDYSSEANINLRGKQSSEVKRVNLGRPMEGNHFIWIKFRKDSSVDENYDSLQFKVGFLSPEEELGMMS